MSARQLRRLRQALREECAAAKPAKPDWTAQRLRHLGRGRRAWNRSTSTSWSSCCATRFSRSSSRMVDEVFGRASRSLATPLQRQERGHPLACLAYRPAPFHRRLAHGAPLASSGLVVIDRDGDLTFVDRLRRLAAVSGGSAGPDVNRLLLDAAPGSELEWADFDHIAEGRDHIERLIRGALESGAAG